MAKFKKYARIVLKIVVGYFAIGYAVAYLFCNHGLPPHVVGLPHSDLTIKFFQRMPRTVDARKLDGIPIMVMISKNHPYTCQWGCGCAPKPVSSYGHWQVSMMQVKSYLPFYLPYIAGSYNNTIWRVGCRWDDIDNYFIPLSFAWHRLK